MLELPPALRHLLSDEWIHGGLGTTCWECPFADPHPRDKAGSCLAREDYCNDPSEAYWQCNLPTRIGERLQWGEDAPCTDAEWKAQARTELAQIVAQRDESLRASHEELARLRAVIREAHQFGYRYGLGPCVCDVCKVKEAPNA